MIETLTNKQALYFIPLGGSEQFGVNLNVYVHAGKMLAVDCGLGFADERFPGIDLLLPDPELLEENRDQLVGMFITHAHEDHIGAVAHLWPRLKCPLYATPFTANILKRKLEENDIKKAKITIVDPAGEIDLGPFSLSFVPVAHSIPDAASVVIRAGGVSALHSGDWNLDPAPVAGAKTDKARFKALCADGVDAYIGDSTNSGVPGRAGSESEVEDGLYSEIAKYHGRIFVTTFSSNIGRLMSIMRAAKLAGRKVAVVGRSMQRMLSAAMECGLISDDVDILDMDAVLKLPDDQVMIICTGSQGEARAALSKIARGDHKAVSTKPGDVVIYSARTIPGNELAINSVKNNLIQAGVRVVTPRDSQHKIHVSGHPCQDEILELWNWVKPRCVIPVHGEREQLDTHAQLARTAQVPNVVVPQNGSVIEITAQGVSIVDHVVTGLLAVDQKRVITAHHRSITARRKLQYTGTAFGSIAVNAKGKMVGDPFLETVGLIDESDDADLKIEDHLYDTMIEAFDDMRAADRKDDGFVAEALRIAVRRKANQILGLRPKTIIHVIRV
ncbi:MAG: MBL fold hydrolase [Alphaproteobacteria bacterium]|nr:MBL fold hydrolase [Alphaproteobacteria bacterium]